MSPRKIARRRFWKDLTRTRHMTAVSAVILGTTFMPLLGVPDIYELRAVQSGVEGFSDARAEVLAPRRNDEAARERSARSIIGERDDPRADQRGSDRVLTVERPERDPAEALDAASILPLPPVEAPQLASPIDEEEAVLPEPMEDPETAPVPEPEEQPMDEEKPEAIEEEEAL